MKRYRITVKLREDIVRYTHHSSRSIMQMMKLVRESYPDHKSIEIEIVDALDTDTETLAAVADTRGRMSKECVIVTVVGGVADVEYRPPDVEVIIVDYDNLNAGGGTGTDACDCRHARDRCKVCERDENNLPPAR